MTESKPVVDKLQGKLQALGLSGPGSTLLHGLAPLAPLVAQLAYIIQPMFEGRASTDLEQLARWLEAPEQIRASARRLPGDDS